MRRIRRPELVPEAFSIEDLAAILRTINDLRGEYRAIGIPKRVWWKSFIMAKYDSGLRLGDMLTLRRSQVREDGRVLLVQNKTAYCHSVMFRPETIAAIDDAMQHDPGRMFIWPLWCGKTCWFKHFQKLRSKAGLKKGTSKWIRRSSASYVEIDHPGMASSHLGHKTPILARKHYLDPRLVDPQPLLPRPIAVDYSEADRAGEPRTGGAHVA